MQLIYTFRQSQRLCYCYKEYSRTQTLVISLLQLQKLQSLFAEDLIHAPTYIHIHTHNSKCVARKSRPDHRLECMEPAHCVFMLYLLYRCNAHKNGYKSRLYGNFGKVSVVRLKGHPVGSVPFLLSSLRGKMYIDLSGYIL